DLNILVTAVTENQRRQSSRWCDSRVPREVMNINSQQGPRSVGHNDMCVPDGEGVTAAQIACGRQRSAVESNGLSGGLEDPDAFAALYGGSHPCFGTRDDDVG